MNLVFVRQIVADGHHVKIARLHNRLDGFGERRFDALLLILVRPRSAILKVLRVVRDLARIDLLIGHGDEALRRALGAPRVHVDFDESVNEIDGCIVLHPIDIELEQVLKLTRLVIADQPGDGFGLTRFGHLARLGQILVGLLEILCVQSRGNLAVRGTGTIHLLDQLAVLFDQSRVQRILLHEAFQIFEAHAEIEIVGARLQNVLVSARTLGRNVGFEIGIEQRRTQLSDLRQQIAASRALGGFHQFLVSKRRQEFLRRHLVVVTATGPEQFGERDNLAVRFFARDQGFQHALLPQPKSRCLVVDDGVDRDSRLRKPVSERLLLRRKRLETFRLKLDERSSVDAIDEWVCRPPGHRQSEYENSFPHD